MWNVCLFLPVLPASFPACFPHLPLGPFTTSSTCFIHSLGHSLIHVRMSQAHSMPGSVWCWGCRTEGKVRACLTRGPHPMGDQPGTPVGTLGRAGARGCGKLKMWSPSWEDWEMGHSEWRGHPHTDLSICPSLILTHSCIYSCICPTRKAAWSTPNIAFLEPPRP